MAVQKVDYEDKIGLQNDPNVPNKSKVTDEDMNQLKSKINNNADELNEAQGDIEDLQQGQGATNGDIASLKNRVSTLELDNTRNKQDIANKVDKVNGKGLSTEDYTTAEKQKLAGLNNYDDTEIKEDIQDIKSEQTTQNTKLQELEDNQIHITTERASNLNVQDASGQNAKIKLFGISKQEGTPSPKSPSEIENTTGNVKIMDYNKNFLGIEDLNHTSAGLNWQITDNEVKITGTTTAVYSTSNEIECFIPAGSYKFLAVNGTSNLTYRIWLYSSKNELLKYPMSGEQFTLTENAVKYRLAFDNLTVGNTYNTTFNPMILLQTETDEEFEAHEEEVKTFPLAQNQKMFEGSETKDDGIHHKRKQREFDGTENWEIYIWQTAPHTQTTIFSLTNILPQKNDAVRYCNYFNVVANTVTNLNKDEEYCLNSSAGTIYFSISNEIATTIEGFKNWLSQQKTNGTPITVEYELLTEEIEAFTEEQQAAYDQLQNAKTYKTVTNVFTDNAEIEMSYIADTKTYVDNEINSIKEQLNTINELLSTTTTSAMLLDNMQSDLESEVL